MPAPWETTDSAPAVAASGGAPWETSDAPVTAPVSAYATPPVSTNPRVGAITRGGDTPPTVDPKDEQNLPQVGQYDYSKSPLRYLMSEDDARKMIAAHANEVGMKSAYSDKVANAVLFMLPQTTKDHMATMIDAATNKDKTWDQLATDYRTKQDATDSAHAGASALGDVVGTGATAIEAAAVNPAIAKVAGTITRKVIIPAAKVAAVGGIFGTAANHSGAFKWLSHILGE